jgi:hypothetical protein
MNTPKMHLRWLIMVTMIAAWVAGCRRSPDIPADTPAGTNLATGVRSNAPVNQPEGDAALRAALDYAAKVREARLQGKPFPPSMAPLPNFNSGPLLPRPLGINFYSIDDRFTNYLQCTYDVSEQHYDNANEAEWFSAALLQVRGSGIQSFPPIKWVAVVIRNTAEHKSEATFEQSFKAAAIFDASDVFDMGQSVQDIVHRSQIDRHPLQYQPGAKPEQRWLIVEQHFATNQTSTAIREKRK